VSVTHTCITAPIVTIIKVKKTDMLSVALFSIVYLTSAVWANIPIYRSLLTRKFIRKKKTSVVGFSSAKSAESAKIKECKK